MSVDEQRSWFEAWCISEGINAERSPVTGVYSYPSARVAWRAWKAAEAAAIERAFEVIKLAIGTLALHGHGEDAKKIAAEWRALLPKEE